jgi:hypothetical protein
MLCSHCILAVLTAYDEDSSSKRQIPPVIQSMLPEIAKKINESLGTDKPNITRPSREAREILKRIDDSLI